ncbi:hypothetical protein EG68_11283 [Paragonimus skrjabini miyazakii]|uniref:Uncharacterized protein n=1 Tax=Paragonimus skrjabini miyazakii TaxID=59628 RepID=A0A8S9YHA4_9TREM|nr:hypothetical protein EG68_11283 [Paragonimus skrjabini miyazakii]
MSSGNYCNPPTDCSDRPAWLIDDTSMELLQAAREQIRDCPPTDQLSDLSLLLQDSNLISLDGFRDRLEQLCNKRFPPCWKYRKRRYGRRVSIRNTRQLRRIQFGHIQNLYRRSRKDAASTILDGRWRNAYLENDFKFSDFNKYWLNILRGQRIIDIRYPRTLLPREDNLAAPITPSEVTRALGNMDGNAPGPDRLTPNDLRRYRPASLSALCNSFLLSGILPKSLNLARVTFVPKVPLPMTPSDFRPISITSVPIQLKGFRTAAFECLHSLDSFDIDFAVKPVNHLAHLRCVPSHNTRVVSSHETWTSQSSQPTIWPIFGVCLLTTQE